MKAAATFSARDFKATGVSLIPSITTLSPVSVVTMEKRYSDEIEGRSATVFTAAFAQVGGKGCYTKTQRL